MSVWHDGGTIRTGGVELCCLADLLPAGVATSCSMTWNVGHVTSWLVCFLGEWAAGPWGGRWWYCLGTGGMEGLWVDLALSRENGAKFRSLTN